MALASGDIFYLQTGTTPKKTTIDSISAYVANDLGTTEHTAADITARDALTGLSLGDRVFVTDASADATVASGWAVYRWDGAAFLKLAEQEGLDVATTTNLGYTAAPAQGTVTSSTGTDATVPLADGTNAGLLAPADFTKLGFITVTQAVDLDAMETDISEHQTLLGVADGSTSLGTFTGTTITDNVTVKAALQEVETALEAATHNPVSELAGDNPIVVGGTGQELSFDISSLPTA